MTWSFAPSSLFCHKLGYRLVSSRRRQLPLGWPMVPARSVATTTISHVPHPAALAVGTPKNDRNARARYARRRASHRAQTLRSITHSKSQRGGRGKFCEHDAQIHGVYARLDDAHEHRTKRGVVGAKSCVRAPPGRLAASVAVEREGRRRSTQDGGPSSELEREAYLRKRDAERRREGGEPARHLRQ